MPDTPKQQTDSQMDDLTYEDVARIVGDLFLQTVRLRQLVGRLTTPVAVPLQPKEPRKHRTQTELRFVKDKGDASG